MAGLNWCRAFARASVVLAILWVVGGCAMTRSPVVLSKTFDVQAAAFIHREGRARISGQAFVRLNSGKLLRAVGTDIVLIPRTDYADERIAALYGDSKQLGWGVNVPEADPLYVQHMRKTIASSGGSFSFDDVADGEYYVVAMIHIPYAYASIERPIYERVTVQNGKNVRIVMRGH